MVPPVYDDYNQETVLYRMSKVHDFDIRTFQYHVKMKMKKIITFTDLGKYDSSSEIIVFFTGNPSLDELTRWERGLSTPGEPIPPISFGYNEKCH